MTTEEDDEWVNVAMKNNNMVVELLMRLTKAATHGPKTASQADLPLNWRIRQPRSKPPILEKDKAESTRESPTTPLSWSGGATSVSGGAHDGFEESSKPLKKPTRRSKVNTTSETTSTKRSRKKKTLPALREEEKLLLREGKKLKSELATLRATVEKVRAANESLKRMKFDTKLQTGKRAGTACVSSEETLSDQNQQLDATREMHVIFPLGVVCNDPNWSSELQEASNLETSSLLPDLNLPLEEEVFHQDLYRTS